MRIAVVGGTGDEGRGLALRWAHAGFEVIIGSRDAARASAAADDLRAVIAAAASGTETASGAGTASGASVAGAENAEAVAECDVVVVTVPFAGQAAIYKSIAGSLAPNAVVCDCTVPVAANVGGKATRTLGVWEGSAAQQAQALLPKGTLVCAAFHSLAAVALNDLGATLTGDVLTCGLKAGKEKIRPLVEAIPDLRFVDAGPLEAARLVEPITALLIGINHRYKTDRSGIQITGI